MKSFWRAILLLAIISCGQQETQPDAVIQKPDTLIPREKMIRIITDVHLAEAAIEHIKNQGLQQKHMTEAYFDAVFSKYRISKGAFTDNFNYYKQNKEDFIRMYEKVIINLEEMKKANKPVSK